MKKVVKFFAWLFLFLTVFFFVYGIGHYSSIKELSTQALETYGIPAIFLISFFLDLFPQFLSGHNLVLVAGLLSFNPIVVIITVLVATFLASVVGFWIGKSFEEGVFREIFGKKVYKNIEKGMNKYGKWYAALSAVSPLPYVPILFGALDMEWPAFLIYGVIPRLLGFIITAIFAYFALPFVLKFFGI